MRVDPGLDDHVLLPFALYLVMALRWATNREDGMRTQLMTRALACVMAVTVVACGGSNPASPSAVPSAGASGGGVGTPVTGRGTITAQIDGVAFSGVATVATNQSGIFAAAASNGVGAITFGFGAVAAVGTTPVNATSPTNANLVVASGTSAQSWAASTAGGSGTLTITSITSVGASGTFAFTLVPVPGSGASGTKSVTSGTFSVTF